MIIEIEYRIRDENGEVYAAEKTQLDLASQPDKILARFTASIEEHLTKP
jgi:hypothetical protein